MKTYVSYAWKLESKIILYCNDKYLDTFLIFLNLLSAYLSLKKISIKILLICTFS